MEKWEKKYGFYSLRADKAKKQKEKEAREVAAAGLQTLLIPDDGSGTTVFEPYSEPWDEGLIIEDDLFAAMISPEGTIQIGDKLFHIDLPNNIVSFIPTASPVPYSDFVSAQPSVSNSQIRYFGMDEDVFALLEGGDPGTEFGASLGAIRIGSGIDCGPGALGKSDKENRYYASNRRLDCKLVYQNVGIYHSMIAKAHHQKKVLGVWVGMPAIITILTPGVFWQPKCVNYVESAYGSYDNYQALYLGVENGDHNTVRHRYFNDMKGLNYIGDVQFRVGNITTRTFHIEDKW